MEKFGIRLPILCALILLVGVTALAAVTGKITMGNHDPNVTVELFSPDESESPAIFKVTPTNAVKDKQYLLVIRKGEAQDPADPTKDVENLVYMGMEKADENGKVQFNNAYPKDMDAGTYYVYLSDYGATNQLKQVATFNVEGGGGLNVDGAKPGDVDGKNGVTPHDASLVLQICAHKFTSYTSEQYAAADVDGKNGVTPHDASLILQKCAHKIAAFPVESE
ncbi:MAG: hypothetical protein IJR72_06390 [Oscillospiraceae bacterium]|nr:hypothetical protein [Oscillospiraceae bacterium]